MRLDQLGHGCIFLAQSDFTLVVNERLCSESCKVLCSSKHEVFCFVLFLTSFIFLSSEHCVLTWTEKGIYIFIPQNVQVLLWSEVKGNYIFLS